MVSEDARVGFWKRRGLVGEMRGFASGEDPDFLGLTAAGFLLL
jgi:hypothetical protein